MFSSFRSRLWLTYALVVAVVLCVVSAGLVVYLLRTPFLDQQAYLRLERIIESLALRNATLDSLEYGSLDAAQRIDNLLDVRVLVIQPGGDVVIDSRSGIAPPLTPIASNILSYPRSIIQDTRGNAWLNVSYRLPGGDYLLLATPRREIRALVFTRRLRDILRQDLILPFIRAGILALVLALLLAYWMSQWVTAPLRHIADAARKVGTGDFKKIPLEGPKDVQDLAVAFNEMTEQVQSGQQAQRDFVANVSHELKTPLTSIQGFAQAISDGTINTTDGLQESGKVIYDEAGRMYRLVIELLDLARLDSGIARIAQTPVDLTSLLNSIVLKFKPIAQQNSVNLQSEFRDLPLITGDSDRLSEVFTNLLDNAIKHTPAGGEVVVRSIAYREQVEISVSDTGPGIPTEDLSRIFERFYQVDKSRQGGVGRGVGLGLSIARGIIHAHGGTIFANNLSLKGSIFIVRLPVAPSQVTRLPRQNSSPME